jgi:hypothetical protein
MYQKENKMEFQILRSKDFLIKNEITVLKKISLIQYLLFLLNQKMNILN